MTDSAAAPAHPSTPGLERSASAAAADPPAAHGWPRPAIAILLALPFAPGGIASPDPAAAQVDTVRIELEGESAVVRQRIPNVGDVVRAFAIRIGGQSLDVIEVVREGEALLDARLTEEGDAYRFEVESGAPIVLRYRVEGELERIPLFVPGGEAELTVARGVEEPFLIRLTGDPARLQDLDAATTLPRFTRVLPGTLEARLSSLPSFVRLSRGGWTSFSRLADVAALLLICLGVFWALRRLRARRTARPPGEDHRG